MRSSDNFYCQKPLGTVLSEPPASRSHYLLGYRAAGGLRDPRGRAVKARVTGEAYGLVAGNAVENMAAERSQSKTVQDSVRPGGYAQNRTSISMMAVAMKPTPQTSERNRKTPDA